MAGELSEQKFGTVTVLYGPERGRYPDGNCFLVEGPEESVLIDPALGMIDRKDALPRVDRVLNSHCHEDHYAGNHLYPDVPWHCHEDDIVGFRSLEDMLEIYGYNAEIEKEWCARLIEKYHYTPREDAVPFADGAVFELGGSSRVRVIHAPGHTRGQCFFWIEPEDMLYLADVDLSSFGPYYGDAWSDLECFEATLAAVREIDVRWYATFHHIGVLEGRQAYLERLDRFTAVIASREERLLAYLAEPHTLDEIAAHRFVYRPKDPVAFAVAVERRSMAQHVDRLVRDGRVTRIEPGLYRT